MNTGLSFPYRVPRVGQKELIELLVNLFEEGGTLVIDAPSGFGKTVCILTAFNEILKRESRSALILVTRTKRQIVRIIEEYLKLRRNLNYLKPVALLPRFELCIKRLEESFSVERPLFSSYCRYMIESKSCGYYLRTYAMPLDELEARRNEFLSIENLFDTGKTLFLCPYEALMVLALNSNLLLMTYPYFFSSSFKRFQNLLGTSIRKLCYVFDEAHSLNDALQSSFSIALTEDTFSDSVAWLASFGNSKLVNQLVQLTMNFRSLSNLLLSCKCASGESALAILLKDLKYNLSQMLDELKLFMLKISIESQRDVHIPAVFTKFLEMMERTLWLSEQGVSQSSIALSKTLGNNRTAAIIFKPVTPPTLNLKLSPVQSVAVVYLSATPIAPELFRQFSGIGNFLMYWKPPPITSYLPRLLCLVDATLSSRLRERKQENLEEIARRLHAFINCVPGNVGAFFCSYAMLNAIAPRVRFQGDIKILIESRRLTDDEAEKIMRTFKAQTPGKKLLLAVQNGRFSEGEDFAPGSFKGIAIIGLALPRPSRELITTIKYLKPRIPSAYTRVFIQPAIRACLQSIGRALRAPSDRISIYLLDNRFLDEKIIRELPLWLKQRFTIINDGDQLTKLILQFYSEP